MKKGSLGAGVSKVGNCMMYMGIWSPEIFSWIISRSSGMGHFLAKGSPVHRRRTCLQSGWSWDHQIRSTWSFDVSPQLSMFVRATSNQHGVQLTDPTRIDFGSIGHEVLTGYSVYHGRCNVNSVDFRTRVIAGELKGFGAQRKISRWVHGTRGEVSGVVSCGQTGCLQDLCWIWEFIKSSIQIKVSNRSFCSFVRILSFDFSL